MKTLLLAHLLTLSVLHGLAAAYGCASADSPRTWASGAGGPRPQPRPTRDTRG